MRNRRILLAGAVSLLTLPGVAAAAEAAIGGFRVTRQVQVERLGLVRLDLELADLVGMLPAAGDLHVFSPDGLQLPHRLDLQDGSERQVAARVTAIERRDGGWQIRIDTGAEAATHRALHFEMTRTALAPGVRLEASADGESWRLLAESDLFRLGDQAGMRGASLGYAPTSDRFLRLDWPGEAGFPEAERISLESSPASALEQRVVAPICRRPAPAETVCRLTSDAPGAHRLSLELTGRGVVGYRLARARGGIWQPLAEGLWHLGSGAARVRVLHIASLEEPAELRLELAGDIADPTTLTAYSFEYPSQTVTFRAAAAGRYTLAWGGGRREGAGTLQLTSSERRDAARVEPGAAEEHPWPALPAAAIEPRTALPAVPFSTSWEVRAPAAERGSVVRLALPPAVLRVADTDLADIRLAVDDRQLPFLLQRPEVPVAVLAGTRRQPLAAEEETVSTLGVELQDDAIGLSLLELTTGEGPFLRQVRVRTIPSTGRKLGLPPTAGHWQPWLCEPTAPLPCRLGRPVPPIAGPGRLELELDDGDNPPLGELRIDLWRRDAALIFVWPARGGVRLLAGNPELAPAAYDLQLLRERLLRRDWLAAELDLAATAAQHAETERRGRLVLTAVLVVAALFLLLLLARVLRSAPDTQKPETGAGHES